MLNGAFGPTTGIARNRDAALRLELAWAVDMTERARSSPRGQRSNAWCTSLSKSKRCGVSRPTRLETHMVSLAPTIKPPAIVTPSVTTVPRMRRIVRN